MLGAQVDELREHLPFDHQERAAILMVDAITDGDEACTWVDMLRRKYVDWAAQMGHLVETYQVHDTGTGIGSVSMRIGGMGAFGLLAGERGVHRLIRISRTIRANVGRRGTPGSRCSPWRFRTTS
jgi:peptide chain release factor 2